MLRPPGMDLNIHWLVCYAMISRSTSLEGFLVLRPADRKKLSHAPPKYLVDEIDRLLALENESTDSFMCVSTGAAGARDAI